MKFLGPNSSSGCHVTDSWPIGAAMSQNKRGRIFVVGINHKSGSAFLREKLFLDTEMLPEAYTNLLRKGIKEALLLLTCDRVEIQGAHSEPKRAADQSIKFLSEILGKTDKNIEDVVYTYFDESAVRHIFSVASSLDSQVIGEPQVLGQLKDAHRFASSRGMIGPEIDKVLQQAYSAAKRIRSETTIGERAVSIASAAIQIAEDIHGKLHESNTLIIGLSEIGNLLVRHLRAAGGCRFTLSGLGRGTSREAVALGFQFLPFCDLEAGLTDADITISTASLGHYVIQKNMVNSALRSRRRRAMLFIDGGLPSDVEPQVHDLDGVFLYTLDDLEKVARQGRIQRESVADEAWEIIDDSVSNWIKNTDIESVLPTLLALRAQFEGIRKEVLKAHPEVDASEATRLLINRLLHTPTSALKELAIRRNGNLAGENLLRRLFELDNKDKTRSR